MTTHLVLECLCGFVVGTSLIIGVEAKEIGHEAVNTGLLIVVLILAIALIDRVRSIPRETANKAADAIDPRLSEARRLLDEEKSAHTETLRRLRLAEAKLREQAGQGVSTHPPQ